jgi:hypothetical protein
MTDYDIDPSARWIVFSAAQPSLRAAARRCLRAAPRGRHPRGGRWPGVMMWAVARPGGHQRRARRGASSGTYPRRGSSARSRAPRASEVLRSIRRGGFSPRSPGTAMAPALAGPLRSRGAAQRGARASARQRNQPDQHAYSSARTGRGLPAATTAPTSCGTPRARARSCSAGTSRPTWRWRSHRTDTCCRPRTVVYCGAGRLHPRAARACGCCGRSRARGSAPTGVETSRLTARGASSSRLR